jgi:hypothetical protein
MHVWHTYDDSLPIPPKEIDGKRALAVRSQESSDKMYLVNMLLSNINPSKQGELPFCCARISFLILRTHSLPPPV